MWLLWKGLQEKMIVSPLQYRGNKYKSLKHLIFPEGSLFVDVFGGSGVVTMNQTGPRIYNDINPEVCNFLRQVRDDPLTIIEGLHLHIHAREIWERLVSKKTKRTALEYLIVITESFASSEDTWARRILEPFFNFREYRIPQIIQASAALRGVEIHNKPFHWILREYDDPNTVFYLDPPYCDTDSHYGQIDHVGLLSQAFNMQSFVGASHYEHTIYRSREWDFIKNWKVQGTISSRGHHDPLTEFYWVKNGTELVLTEDEFYSTREDL